MLYSLRGILIHKEDGIAVIECGGVGYKCMVTLSTLSKLPSTGNEVTVYTHMNVREDAIDLFGFYEMAELNCFKMLTSVSGVGPKAALSILSNLSPERFALCVAANDVKSLTRSQGIGPKIAQRIILELKDKVKNDDIVKGVGDADVIPGGTLSSNAGEAVSALVVLGYAQADAATVIAKFSPDMPIEEMIKQGLKQLAGQV